MPDHQEPTTERLMSSVVQSLFGVFGTPDDPDTGNQADDLLQCLHERLATAAG